MNDKGLNIKKAVQEACSEICDKYCKWPDSYDLTNMDEDEAAWVLYEEHCNHCPLLPLID